MTISKFSKKSLGKYYTPDDATKLLCHWVIQSKKELILEPSFGGCGFLEASRNRLKELGSRKPERNIFGCDIDKEAFGHLNRKLGFVQTKQKFIHADFLLVSPKEFSVNFDVVVGNPPYISSHNMSLKQKRCLEQIQKDSGSEPLGHASLWAYFLLHSLKFLKANGRIAWILPGSILTSRYSTQIREVLNRNFNRVLFVSLGEKLFQSEGTDEASVILIADGFGHSSEKCITHFHYASNMKGLSKTLKNWSEGRTSNFSLARNQTSHHPVNGISANIYKEISTSPETVVLEKVGKFKIGLVTGANNFFILTDQERIQAGLPVETFTKVFHKSRYFKGCNLGSKDLRVAISDNARCLMLQTEKTKHLKTVKNYLKSFDVVERSKNRTFKKRKTWHEIKTTDSPEAFFIYMNDIGPRLVLNTAKVNCTNSTYQFFFDRKYFSRRYLILISMLTTYSQYDAEIKGRIYGQGILKHEPSDAKKISIFLPSDKKSSEIRNVFNEIDTYLRVGSFDEARSLADAFIFHGTEHEANISCLSKKLEGLRKRRRKK